VHSLGEFTPLEQHQFQSEDLDQQQGSKKDVKIPVIGFIFNFFLHIDVEQRNRLPFYFPIIHLSHRKKPEKMD
jgi:hypothetical protein